MTVRSKLFERYDTLRNDLANDRFRETATSALGPKPKSRFVESSRSTRAIFSSGRNAGPCQLANHYLSAICTYSALRRRECWTNART